MNRRDLLKSFACVSALPMVKDVEVLRLSPTDTLVITCAHDLEEAEAAHLHASVQRHLPGARVLVLAKGLDVKVVRQ